LRLGIVGLDDETVTIQYKERRTGRSRTCRLSGHEFMRRFLQHVLPRGFHKVRYFGLWHPAQRHNAVRVRQMLQLQATPKFDPPPDFVVPPLTPALSGAADLHPHALAASGHGAVITTSTSAANWWSRCRVSAHAMEICCQQCNSTPAY